MGQVRKTEIVLGEHLMLSSPILRLFASYLKAILRASELTGIGGLRYSKISIVVFAVRGSVEHVRDCESS